MTPAPFFPLGQMLQQSYKIHDLYNEITICSQKYWNLQHKQYEKQQNAKLTTKNDLLYPTESWPSDQIPYTRINQSKPDKNNLTTIIIKKTKRNATSMNIQTSKNRNISNQNKYPANSKWKKNNMIIYDFYLLTFNHFTLFY